MRPALEVNFQQEVTLRSQRKKKFQSRRGLESYVGPLLIRSIDKSNLPEDQFIRFPK
jgi:hypothetical protein